MKALTCVCFYLTLINFACSPRIITQPLPNSENSVINVMNFGAKGDGKTDDTEAIQKAIDYAQKKGFSKPNISHIYSKTIYFGAMAKVHFPCGQYQISKPLKIGSYVNVISDKAVLLPSKSFKSSTKIAINTVGWQTRIEGLQFIGFDEAIVIATNNVNIGKVVIRDCDFIKNGTAINLDAPSSLSIIDENRFIDNQKALIVKSGDKVIFENNWVTSSKLKGLHDAQIINNGILHFDKNLLVPTLPEKGAVEPAWINNYYSVIANGVRQGGEHGSFTLVNNFSIAKTKSPFWPTAVIIRDSECYAVYGNRKDYKQPAAIRLINIPNQIVIENIRGLIEASTIGFSEKKKSNLEELMKERLIEKKISIIVKGIVGGDNLRGDTNIPKELEAFLR